MILLGRHIIDKFQKKHARSRKSLSEWLHKITAAKWEKFSDIKKTFNSVDKNGNECIFDIGGNNYRLIAIVELQDELVRIKAIYTHDEYTKKYNKG